MRLTWGIATALVVLALPGPADARLTSDTDGSGRPATWTGETRVASAVFQLAGHDHRTWIVRLSAEGMRPVGGEWSYSILTGLQRCTATKTDPQCDPEQRYVRRVEGGEVRFADDLSSVQVLSTVAGASLSLVWQVQPRQASVEVSAGNDGARVRRLEGGIARVSGSVLAVPCVGEGTVRGDVWISAPVSATTGESLANLPEALRTSAAARPRCLPAAEGES